jgi:hypothetical protein
MTTSLGQSSEAVLEDALSANSTYEEGYTNYGSAIEDEPDQSEDLFWIQRARSSYESGQTWFDTSIRRRMEDNMRLFNSDHPRGSRYRDDMYNKRSKLFRPKTRSAVRKTEAAAAAAFFATSDALTCTPPNPRDKQQKLAADSMAELLNYRLQHQIPWFMTCIGAVQDAAKQGVVISKQHWVFREAQDVYDNYIMDAMTGEEIKQGRTIETRIVADHPDITLRPVENILFSPAADWRNPLQSSPYLIDQEPFYAGDIIQKAIDGPQGQYDTAWRQLDMATIRSALQQNYDPVRQAREGYREDRYEESHSDIQAHDIVWVHHNYMRIDGQEWYYATLGTEIMLSVSPVPLEEVTPLKERPYVLGVAVIETHKTYPSSLVELARPLQEEINDITNLRIDNIRHIISPRYFIKRGTSVDIRSLLRNIAGGVTAMEDPKKDVEIRQIADTTSSAFQEQDRLSVEMDEVVGSFSQSSVAANHNINERVGNTQMLGESANQITEFNIRTFSETWVEKVLQQIMELERALESDAVVMAIIGQKMNIPPEQVFSMLELPVQVTVNVGFGATNPQKRIQKVAMAFETIGNINPEWVAKADQREVVTEILAAVGFKNVERFFPDLAGGDEQQDPQVAQLQQENDQLKAMLEGDGQKHEAALKGKEMDGQIKLQIEDKRLGYQREKDMSTMELSHKVEEGKWNMKMLDISIDREQNEMRKQELVQQRIALNHTIEMDERQYEMAVQQAEWQHGQDLKAEAVEKETIKAPPGGKPTATGPTTVKEPSAKAAKPKEPKRIASTPKIGNDDMAGVIARGRYGAIPGEEG